MLHKLSKIGYIVANNEIISISYREYVETYGSDETTTGKGVAPRLYVDGNTIMTWGCNGNRHAFYASFKNKREATATLYEIWEQNVSDNCDAPRFFATKKELFEDYSDITGREVKVIKRYFRIIEAKKQKKIQAKIKHDSRPLTTKEMMIDFIVSNKKMVQTSLNELNALKLAENKPEWQVKANALIQKVCNNDFRVLNWKEIYNLIKETA